ncbi:MAG: anthranilate synthase component I family protein [Syntrophobacteraceae bacterium]
MRELLSGSCSMEIENLQTFEAFDEAKFLQGAQARVCQEPSALLLSGGELRLTDENRYSILAFDPLIVLSGKKDASRVVADSGVYEFSKDPVAVFEMVCQSLRPNFGLEGLPFLGGAVGYFSYDLKNCIEKLAVTVQDDICLPDLFLFWPRRIEVYDRKLRKLSRIVLKCPGSLRLEEDAVAARVAGRFLSAESFPIGNPNCGCKPGAQPFEAGPLESNFSHEGYLLALRKVRDYIRNGDVYQVNLSQRFSFPFKGDPFELWKALFDVNPAPFYAYINGGDHQILSTSMERFLLRRGHYIETRPIKGTRKRGETQEEDRELRAQLLGSLKDDAELSMIVDLLRNDLGKICRAGTVKVAEHKRIESYENVHHLISIVTGALKEGITPGEILRATFPGGSITGCPKIRAMEIIDELESHARHVYTGSVGYIGWHDNLDLNIAIRTAIVKGGSCYFSVGGGVIYDSIEEEEYQETFHKGRTLLDLIEKIRGKS